MTSIGAYQSHFIGSDPTAFMENNCSASVSVNGNSLRQGFEHCGRDVLRFLDNFTSYYDRGVFVIVGAALFTTPP